MWEAKVSDAIGTIMFTAVATDSLLCIKTILCKAIYAYFTQERPCSVFRGELKKALDFVSIALILSVNIPLQQYSQVCIVCAHEGQKEDKKQLFHFT